MEKDPIIGTRIGFFVVKILVKFQIDQFSCVVIIIEMTRC